jgi:hypothetical protein
MRARPYDLDVNIVIHGEDAETAMRRHHWWLIIALVLLAVFMIGVGVTDGIR